MLADIVPSGNGFSGRNANDTKLLCCVRFVYRFCYLFIKNHKKRCLSVYSAHFLAWVRCIRARSRIFGVLNCFATHIHISHSRSTIPPNKLTIYCCSVPTDESVTATKFSISLWIVEVMLSTDSRFVEFRCEKSEGSRTWGEKIWLFRFCIIRFDSFRCCAV